MPQALTFICLAAVAALLFAARFARAVAYRVFKLEPYCSAVIRERVVDEGDIITARGVSSAIDLGLHVIQRLAGPDARDRVAAQMDYPYRWD